MWPVFFSFKYVILFPKRLTDYTKLLGRFPCCIFDESQKFKILIIAPVFTVPQTLHSYASLNFWDEAVIPGSVTRFSRSDVRFPNPTRKTFMAVGEPDYWLGNWSLEPTFLMWPWRVKIATEDFADVTLSIGDTLWRWCLRCWWGWLTWRLTWWPMMWPTWWWR